MVSDPFAGYKISLNVYQIAAEEASKLLLPASIYIITQQDIFKICWSMNA